MKLTRILQTIMGGSYMEEGYVVEQHDDVLIFEYNEDIYDYGDEIRYTYGAKYQYEWIKEVINLFRVKKNKTFYFDTKQNFDCCFKLWKSEKHYAGGWIIKKGNLYQESIKIEVKDETKPFCYRTNCKINKLIVKVKDNIFD